MGRALQQLGIELIAAYSPEARGRSERMFGTLQKRLPQERGPATTMEDANRYLKEVFWPAHNRRFARPAEASGSAFVAFAGTLADILGVQHRRQVGNGADNLILQIPADRQRHHYDAGARISRRPAGRLPRTQVPGPLQGRQHLIETREQAA